MRKLIAIIFLFYNVSHSQSNQIMYDFAQLPQTLLINPGGEIDNKFFIGFPLFSEIKTQIGFSGPSVYEIFSDDGVNINEKIAKAVSKFGKSEFLAFNQQIELISAGFRLNDNKYLSFGYYEEADMLLKIPKDVISLLYSGNPAINRRYTFNKLAARADLLGVLHIGLSKKIDEKLTLGLRAKLYSGIFNVSSKLNSGTFITSEGTDNIYRQYLENFNFLVQTSGLVVTDSEQIDASYMMDKFLFGGNLGFGLDVGFTYHIDKQWSAGGSLQDLGFINNKQNLRSYKMSGNFEFDGVELDFSSVSSPDYWNELKSDFDSNITLEEEKVSYISTRPAKFNGAITYSFGKPTFDDCRFLKSSEYRNKVGAYLNGTVGSVHSYFAATLFYEHKFSNHFYSKVTYTADPFSYANFGLGMSAQFGFLNLYLMADNLGNLSNLYNAKNASVLFGINFIVYDKK